MSMRSIVGAGLKWFFRGALAVLLLVVTAVVGIYVVAQWRLHRTYDVALTDPRVAPSPDLSVEGERLAHVHLCVGCHHEAGNTLFEDPMVARLTAPNLSAVAPLYSDAELARLVRKGVKRDGTSALVMPARVVGNISDDELAAIIAWLRTLPPRPDAAPPTALGPIGYVAIALGKVDMSADTAPRVEPPETRPTASPEALGRYLVASACHDCHELNQGKDNGFGVVTPALQPMVKSHSAEDFARLMKTGIAAGGREVGLMSEEARLDFAFMTDTEIAAIKAYLDQDDMLSLATE